MLKERIIIVHLVRDGSR